MEADVSFLMWIKGFRGRALAQGIAAATLDAALNDVAPLPEVIAKDRHQAEFTRTIWEYLDSAVSDRRISDGIAALQQNVALLNRIEAAYGIDKAVLVAIWGMESNYGTTRGDIPTIAALATLAHDGRRPAFFEGELIAALKILQAVGIAAQDMRGSWAGAMGHTQFMPSAYLNHAVAFSTPGHSDICSDDPTDALASTAAYLAHWGWQTGAPWVAEVQLPDDFDHDLAGKAQPAARWQALGVKAVHGALPDLPASLLLPGGARGAALLTYPNFQVIRTYNAADAYVIATGHLADRIRGGPAFCAPWPRDLRALSRDERCEMQQRLTSAGHDTGGVDGLIGPRTITAIRSFQRAMGLVPDGYPSLEVLAKLR